MSGKTVIRGLLVCGILAMFAGCATSSGRRFYSSEASPRQDVAVILTKANCHLDGVTPEGHTKMDLWGDDSVLGELLPGTYLLDLRYQYKGDYSSARSGNMSYNLYVSAGHLYYIYAEFPAPNTWRPAVIDIASDGDYQKVSNLNHNGWLGSSDEDPEFVRKMVNRYFAGPRTPLKREDHSGIMINGKKTDITLWK